MSYATVDIVDLPEYLPESSPEAPSPSLVRFARMAGSSIAARDAAFWITDFLNAAYYRRPATERDVDELRLAFSVLTTYWYRRSVDRRLRLSDLPAFHRAFGAHRFAVAGGARGTLTPTQLLDGAVELLGDWFPEAYGDPQRRGWGIAFPTHGERVTYDPACRLRLARVGALTPESAPAAQQVWHTYPAVEMPSVDRVVAALTAPETWPDFASEIGRFTPLRPGGLDGQTFEIEVAAGVGRGFPVFTRGYVTITQLLTADDPQGLARWVQDLEDGLARHGHAEPRAVPEDGQPLVGFDLTTHDGHFMGAGHNRLLLFTHGGRAWVRAAGTWDPMPRHIEQTYRVAGRAAQHAFWGQGNVVSQSMLHQLAGYAAA